MAYNGQTGSKQIPTTGIEVSTCGAMLSVIEMIINLLEQLSYMKLATLSKMGVCSFVSLRFSGRQTVKGGRGLSISTLPTSNTWYTETVQCSRNVVQRVSTTKA